MWNRLRIYPKTAVACVLVALAVGSARAEDWTQYRGPNRDGVSSEEIISWPPTEHWSASIGVGYSAVVVSEGRVYAIGHDAGAVSGALGLDTVSCMDVATGAVLWTYAYKALSERGNFAGATPLDSDAGPYGSRATPLVDGDRIYTLSVDGSLHCLDKHTGKVLWYGHRLNRYGSDISAYGSGASPLVYGDTLIVDIGPKCVGVNKWTGDLLWEQPVEFSVFSSMSPLFVTLGGIPCVIFGERTVTALRIDTGMELWQKQLDRSAIATHVISGNTLFYSTYPDTGTCEALLISEHGSSVLWSGVEASGNQVRTYHLNNVVVDGALYAMDNSTTEWYGTDYTGSSFRCIDLKTGLQHWNETGMGWASPVAVGSDILILKQGGDLLRATASPSAYVEDASVYSAVTPICWTYPVVSNGRVYCRNYDGDLVCLFIAPSVSVHAVDRQALETSDVATFRISRTSAVPAAPPASPLDVTIDIGGTGVRDTHYTLTGGSITAGPASCTVTIPASASSVDVTVTALTHADTDTKSVSLSVQRVAGSYVADAASTASVTVHDAGTVVPTVSIQSVLGSAYVLEGGPDEAHVTIARTGSPAEALDVDIALGGTAPAGDYVVSPSQFSAVTIPAGESEIDVYVAPLDNAVADGDRTVMVTLSAMSAFFTRDAADYAVTVTIVDDDDALSDAADSDGLDDGWELCYFGDVATTDGSLDSDGDSLDDAGEHTIGADPTVQDTDGDGASDGVDAASYDAVWSTYGPDMYIAMPAPMLEGGNGCVVSRGAQAGRAIALVLTVGALYIALGLRRRTAR